MIQRHTVASGMMRFVMTVHDVGPVVFVDSSAVRVFGRQECAGSQRDSAEDSCQLMPDTVSHGADYWRHRLSESNLAVLDYRSPHSCMSSQNGRIG